MAKMEHPNILKTYGAHDKGIHTKPDGRTSKIFYTVLEVASHGEIFEYLSLGGPFKPAVARSYFKQLISALEHCHNRGYAHRDIKPENLLLDESYQMKLCDFGFAKYLKDKGLARMKTKCGTAAYMAPEITKGEGYDGVKADIFCAGIMLYIFASGRPPFNGATPSDQRWVKYFVNCHMKDFWKMVQARNGLDHGEDFKDIIAKLLHPDPKERITIAQVKEHPYWAGETATLAQIKDDFSCRQFKVDTQLLKDNYMKQRERVDSRRDIPSNFDVNRPSVGPDEIEDVLDSWDFDNWEFDNKLWKHVHDHICDLTVDIFKHPIPYMDFKKHEHCHDRPEKPMSCFHTKGDFKDFLQIILYGCERQGIFFNG
jgi:serine/threonine protein kinase